MQGENAPSAAPKMLPLVLLVEGSDGESFPCDECEDPEECVAEGYCELGLTDAGEL